MIFYELSQDFLGVGPRFFWNWSVGLHYLVKYSSGTGLRFSSRWSWNLWLIHSQLLLDFLGAGLGHFLRVFRILQKLQDSFKENWFRTPENDALRTNIPNISPNVIHTGILLFHFINWGRVDFSTDSLLCHLTILICVFRMTSTKILHMPSEQISNPRSSSTGEVWTHNSGVLLAEYQCVWSLTSLEYFWDWFSFSGSWINIFLKLDRKFPGVGLKFFCNWSVIFLELL